VDLGLVDSDMADSVDLDITGGKNK